MSQSRGKLVRVAESIAVVIISVAFALSLAPRARADDVSADPRVQQGLVIAPVPLNLQGKDQALVGLGSYFVNAMAIPHRTDPYPHLSASVTLPAAAPRARRSRRST